MTGRAQDQSRVLVVTATLAEGGAERFASRLLCGLDRSRLRPSLALFRDKLDYPLPGDLTPYVLEQESFFHSLRTVGRLRRLFREERPEVVLSCGAYTSLFVGEALHRFKDAPRWIARVGNDPAQHPAGRMRALINARLARHYTRAEHLVANSQGLLGAVKQHFPAAAEHCTQIPNPVDLEELHKAAKEDGAPVPLPGRRVLLHLGRLHAQKRPEVLLAAMARLRTDCELWFCGDGPMRPALEREAAELGLHERVRFLGFQRNPAPTILASDLIVSASAHEGLPNALIEAQARGKVVLAPRCDYGVDEVIVDGESGLLLDEAEAPELSSALATQIDVLLADPARLTRFGNRAAQHARRFDADLVLERWQSLLEGKLAQ